MPCRRRGPWALAVTLLTGASVALAHPFQAPRDSAPGATFRVGIDAGDVRGDDHRALQAAVDYVAGLGGGTVLIGPGRYTMRNALVRV